MKVALIEWWWWPKGLKVVLVEWWFMVEVAKGGESGFGEMVVVLKRWF